MMMMLLEVPSSDMHFGMFSFIVLTDKVCDAVEVAGRNVMKTSSNVATEIVDHK